VLAWLRLRARSLDFGDGAPGEIRTPGLLVRSQALYPTELRALRGANITTSIGEGYLAAQRAGTRILLAEREGFEPSMGF
jgi:hypothetical protein